MVAVRNNRVAQLLIMREGSKTMIQNQLYLRHLSSKKQGTTGKIVAPQTQQTTLTHLKSMHACAWRSLQTMHHKRDCI